MVRYLSDTAGQLANRPGLLDFQREAAEFEARKRQRQMQEQMMPLQMEKARLGLEKMKRDMNAPQLPFQGTSFDAQIANEAYKFNLSKGMDDASARQKAVDMVLGSKVDYTMVTDPYTGQSMPVAKPRAGMFGGAARTPAFNPNAPHPMDDPMLANQQAAADQAARVGGYNPNAEVPAQMTQEDIQERLQDAVPELPLQEPTDFYSMMGLQKPQVDPRATQSPDVQKSIAEAEAVGNIELANKMRMKQFETNLQRAEAELKTGKAQGTIKSTLNDLEDLNNALKVKEAIVSGDQSLLQKMYAGLGSTKIGQIASKYSNTDVQSLREEYERKRDSLIPFYISYFELPATVVDTEEFQQRILKSFGDPGLIYEANAGAIQNMRRQFGLTEDGQQQTPRAQQLKQKYGLE